MKPNKSLKCFFLVSATLALAFQYPAVTSAQLSLPEAISIVPEDASPTDTITLTLDLRKICTSDKSLPFSGQDTLYMSGAAINHWEKKTAWWNMIAHPENGRDGTPSRLSNNGDSTYSIRFMPSSYFALPPGNIKAMYLQVADFNQGRQAYDSGPFGCTGFYIPLLTQPPDIDTIAPGVTVEIGGLFKEDIVLDFDTIRIKNYVNIEYGSTFRISPGTYVEFQGNYSFSVLGTFIAEGTESDSIIFAAKDPATGWSGLWFKEQADTNTSLFAYCQLRHMRTDHDWHGVVNAEYYPRLRISHSLISDNFAHAINLTNSDISLDHSTLADNDKGGIHSYASNAMFLNCRVIDNNSHAMYLNLSNPQFLNCIIANNAFRGMTLTAADPRFINSIIAKNGEWTIWMEISNPEFYNSIIWGNRMNVDATDPTSSLLVQNCILPDKLFPGEYEINILGGNNVYGTNPMFLNAPADTGRHADVYTADWRVPMNSPLVNNGTLDIEGIEIPQVDLGGEERVAYGIIDIGPFEFSQSTEFLTLDADITTDTIMMADTIKVTTDIMVHNGATLTIAPGTIVEFQGHYGMIIEGCLIARGSEGNKIRFTIHDTSGYYDLDTTLGTWGGMDFRTSQNPPSVIDHCIFEYSAAMTGDQRYGGAIFIDHHSSPEWITNCLFRYNFAHWQGGALSIGWASTQIMFNEFHNNLSNEGGAIHTHAASSPHIQDNYIHHNNAWSYGGGIYSSGAAVIAYNRVGYNTANLQGGGIYCRKSKAFVVSNTIYNNRKGGLAVKNCDPLILNNLIVNNTADGPMGGWDITREGSGIFIDINSDALIAHNTIANNFSSQFKGSSVRLYSPTRFLNNIVWGNRDDFENPAPIAIEGAIEVDVRNCIVEGGIQSIRAENSGYSGIIEHIIDSFPQFMDPSGGTGIDFDAYVADWNINALSPAINNALWNNQIFQNNPIDIMNYTRDFQPDIGAYEHQTGRLEMFSQPVDIVACNGDSAEFSVLANDTAYYQWYRNEVMVEGANSPVLNLESVDQDNEGVYHCLVWNAYGHRISEPSFLIVNHPPEIFIQPENNWMIDGTPVKLEVRAEGSPPMEFQWFKDGNPIPGADQPKIVSQPSAEKEGRYHCTIGNFCGSVSTDAIQLFLAPQICMVTVDTATGDNLIIWEKKGNAPISSYNVYRESVVRGQYEVLANIPAENLSLFSDTTANPAEQAYIYKITALDHEGYESDISLCKPHKTIHLLTSFNTESLTAQLDWDEYYGFGYGTYFIYRSDTKTGFNKVKDISSSFKTWLDTDAEPSTRYYYRVSVQKPEPCSPTENGKKAGTGPYTHSLSNLDDNKLKATGLQQYHKAGDLLIFPNPMTESTVIRFPNPEMHEYSLNIRNLSGKLVRVQDGVTSGEVIINREGLIPGYYSIEIKGADVFRGILIIK